MSNVGRFEILSPIFSGALDTSTARDPQTGDTVLLHLLPAGHTNAPHELFREIAPDWPGEILDSGFDATAQRSFVVTEYPKDRKAFRLLIHTLSELTVPVRPADTAAPEPAPVLADQGAAADTAADLLAFFKAQTVSTKPAAQEPQAVAAATRMFDPSAVFDSAAAPVAPAAKEQPAPPQDGATRIFDPSAVFGAAEAPPETSSQPAAAPASDSATRMFDPSAVFGAAAPAPAKSAPPAAPREADGATRMFDPTAVFGAPAPKPKTPPKEESVYDSSKRAAEDFISGRLPAEFRDAPIKVQRSLEELLGRKAEQPDVKPTPGRPGVITLMFDAYGKRIEQSEGNRHAEVNQPPAPSLEPATGATKMISSADLSVYFAADGTSGGVPATPESASQDPAQESSRDRK